jgi:hypothetical protein
MKPFWNIFYKNLFETENFFLIEDRRETRGLYYKIFTIVIYDRNAIGQYYETTRS